MTAMGVEHFVVTLVDAKQGKQEVRQWRKAEVIKSVPWLKRMNARGYDVWIRPAGEHGLVLLGGLNKNDLQTLRDRGFGPAAIVETGIEQYQAWVKLSEHQLGESLRNKAAAGLVKGLGYSGTNAISRDDGRLAGFTNQHLQRAAGRHPYVLMAESGGMRAPAASAFLALFEQERTKAREVHHDIHRSRPHGPER